MVYHPSKMSGVSRALRTAVLVLASLALFGCAAPQGAPEAAPEPTPSPAPTPEPTPEPAITIAAGEPVIGMVASILAQENGVLMFLFASPSADVTVVASQSAFIDEIGSRPDCISPGDRVEIVFDSPIIDSGFAQGEAKSVKTLMYADSKDYNDPFFTAFEWMFQNRPELNEGAVAVAFPPEYGAEPTAQFSSALQSFCLQNGYSIKTYSAQNDTLPGNVTYDWLSFDFTGAAQDGDHTVISVVKTRKNIGEAGATLTLALENGVWEVQNIKDEFFSMA